MAWIALRPDLVRRSRRRPPPDDPRRFRLTTTDTVVAGVGIPAGSRVMVAFGSANRDPRQFPDADRFLVDRSPNDHLAFGRGVHFCLGVPVARMIGRVVLEDVVSRTTSIELVGRPERKRNRMLRGFDQLRVSLG